MSASELARDLAGLAAIALLGIDTGAALTFDWMHGLLPGIP